MGKEIIVWTNVKREAGYLYFCGTDKDGFIVVAKTKMARGRNKKSK